MTGNINCYKLFSECTNYDVLYVLLSFVFLVKRTQQIRDKNKFKFLCKSSLLFLFYEGVKLGAVLMPSSPAISGGKSRARRPPDICVSFTDEPSNVEYENVEEM